MTSSAESCTFPRGNALINNSLNMIRLFLEEGALSVYVLVCVCVQFEWMAWVCIGARRPESTIVATLSDAPLTMNDTVNDPEPRRHRLKDLTAWSQATLSRVASPMLYTCPWHYFLSDFQLKLGFICPLMVGFLFPRVLLDMLTSWCGRLVVCWNVV